MKSWKCVTLALLASAAFASQAHAAGGPAAHSNSEVATWNTFASNLVAANQAPGPQTHTLAVTQIAVHDALNAIDPRYEPYVYAGSARGRRPPRQ